MANYVIYTNTVIYMALYLKRQNVPNGTITITQRDMDSYYNAVLNALNAGKRRAPFTYDVIQGEPYYNVNVASQAIKQKIANARFTYDKVKGTYSTSAKSDELEMKSVSMIPISLRPYFISEECKKTLGVNNNRSNGNNNRRGSGSSQPGSDGQ